jgi:hypothetical protein
MGGNLAELLLLAIASAFYPVLIGIDLIAFRASHPARLLAAFLAGGLLTTTAVGFSAVTVLQGTSLFSGSNENDTNHAVGITIGALALLACFVLARGYSLPRQKKKEPDAAKGPGRTERMLARGAPLAFVAGIVLNIVPGVFPLVGIKNISELDLHLAAKLAILVCFNLILFALIEIPLAGFLISPVRTTELTTRFSEWLGRNARRVGAIALGVAGTYLLLRGLIGVLLLS